MKVRFYSILVISLQTLLISVSSIVAQIVVNSDDLIMDIGYESTFYEGNCDNVTFDVAATGADYYWDFSCADTISGMAPASEKTIDPVVSTYPDANSLTRWEMEIQPGFNYIRDTHAKVTSSAVQMIAYEMYSNPASSVILLEFDPYVNSFIFPLTYQSSWSDDYTEYSYHNGVIDDTIDCKTERIADGWGTVKTPYGEYSSLRLRILDYEWSDDSGSWEEPDTSYYWITKEHGIVFMAGGCQYSGPGSLSAYIRYSEAEPVGLGEDRLSDSELKFGLEQNYPNPFNPSTKFKYSVPAGVWNVKIRIFNISGEEVSVLLNEIRKGGIYEAEWNAEDYTSGCYFYEIQVGSFRDVKKMILMK